MHSTAFNEDQTLVPGGLGVCPSKAEGGCQTLASGSQGVSVPKTDCGSSSGSMVDELKKRVPLLECMYGAEDAAFIFASSCRLAAVVSDVLARERSMPVRTAAVLGLAAKFVGIPGCVKQIWEEVAGKPCLPQVLELEERAFAAWAVDGLEGDYALEIRARR